MRLPWNSRNRNVNAFGGEGGKTIQGGIECPQDRQKEVETKQKPAVGFQESCPGEQGIMLIQFRLRQGWEHGNLQQMKLCLQKVCRIMRNAGRAASVSPIPAARQIRISLPIFSGVPFHAEHPP